MVVVVVVVVVVLLVVIFVFVDKVLLGPVPETLNFKFKGQRYSD